MDDPLIFGLSSAILSDLRRVFAAYPEIEQVLIFGSRAKGSFRDGSDIDLAVFAPTMSKAAFTRLWNELDALPILFKMDVLHWDALNNERLKNKICAEGQALFAADSVTTHQKISDTITATPDAAHLPHPNPLPQAGEGVIEKGII